jgi:N6-adenosine-specific RNA methylase IME4
MEYEFHPLAGAFPLLEGDEFATFVDNVRARGVRSPIWLYEGKILDGRIRYRAALAAGVDCPTCCYEGDDPIGFIVTANLVRRDLNASQRAMIADSLATLKLGANQRAQHCAPSQTHAAERCNVSRRSVQYARAISGADPGIADLVRAGIINLQEGKKLVALPVSSRSVAVNAINAGGDVRTAVRAAKKAGYLDRIAATKPKPLEGTYRIIYADPPWKYLGLNRADEYGHAEAHYNSISDDELIVYRPDGERLIKDLVDDNAVLFLWVTAPMLEHAFPIIAAWGFNYKANYVWDKVRHNVGFYNSVRHEHLLICTRGSCTPDTAKLINSVQTFERSNKHSEKPTEFCEIIEAMYDHGRKLELFARKSRPGWDCVGNEIDCRAAA